MYTLSWSFLSGIYVARAGCTDGPIVNNNYTSSDGLAPLLRSVEKSALFLGPRVQGPPKSEKARHLKNSGILRAPVKKFLGVVTPVWQMFLGEHITFCRDKSPPLHNARFRHYKARRLTGRKCSENFPSTTFKYRGGSQFKKMPCGQFDLPQILTIWRRNLRPFSRYKISKI